MARNIVVCSDGTGNTFDAGISNVTRLIRLLALDNHARQIVIYDQGIGTNAKRVEAVRTFAQTIGFFCLDSAAARLRCLAGQEVGARAHRREEPRGTSPERSGVASQHRSLAAGY